MIAGKHGRTFRQQGSLARLKKGWLAVILPACTLMLLPLVELDSCRAQDMSRISSFSKGRTVINGQVHFSKRSDADAGVQLLETIISRVMNIPQVALNKSTSQLAQNQQKLQQQNSPTDYKLAIRPKETGKVFAPAPKNPLIIAQAPADSFNSFLQSRGAMVPPSGGMSNSAPSDDGAFGDEAGAESWKGNSLSRVAMKNEAAAPSAAPGLWEEAGKSKDKDSGNAWADGATSRAYQQSFGGARYASPSASSNHSSGLPQVNNSTYMRQPGDNVYSQGQAAAVRGSLQNRLASNMPTTNMGKYAAPRAKAESLDESRRQVPDLQSQVNKLYKLSKGLEDIQTLQEKQRQIASVRGLSNAREIQLIDDRPSLKDMRQAPTPPSAPSIAMEPGRERSYAGGGGGGGGAGAVSALGDYETDSLSESKKTLAAAPTPSRKAKRSSAVAGGKIIASKEAERYDKSDRAAGYADSKVALRDKLALLPPNVATGIPGLNLNLGTSEVQAVQVLQQSGGKLKQQKIRNWTVYSWTKKETEGDALQLYFRHGMLDAIRIFDPELISSGFGVGPGDPLEVVKEKFGEPAFLLPEPGLEGARTEHGGKNYIYPISQVGFQLARRGGEASPQVASVLIFSVK